MAVSAKRSSTRKGVEIFRRANGGPYVQPGLTHGYAIVEVDAPARVSVGRHSFDLDPSRALVINPWTPVGPISVGTTSTFVDDVTAENELRRSGVELGVKRPLVTGVVHARAGGQSLDDRLEFAREALRRRAENLDDEALEANPIVERIERNYHSKLEVSQIADEAGISRYRLTRDFKQRHGVPPSTYLSGMRVARAANLIRQGLKLSEVALSVGFFDQSHLHRHFRRVFGISPGAYASLGDKARGE